MGSANSVLSSPRTAANEVSEHERVVVHEDLSCYSSHATRIACISEMKDLLAPERRSFYFKQTTTSQQEHHHHSFPAWVIDLSSTCKLDEVAFGLVEEFLVVLPLKSIVEEYLFESSKQQEEGLAAAAAAREKEEQEELLEATLEVLTYLSRSNSQQEYLASTSLGLVELLLNVVRSIPSSAESKARTQALACITNLSTVIDLVEYEYDAEGEEQVGASFPFHLLDMLLKMISNELAEGDIDGQTRTFSALLNLAHKSDANRSFMASRRDLLSFLVSTISNNSSRSGSNAHVSLLSCLEIIDRCCDAETNRYDLARYPILLQSLLSHCQPRLDACAIALSILNKLTMCRKTQFYLVANHLELDLLRILVSCIKCTSTGPRSQALAVLVRIWIECDDASMLAPYIIDPALGLVPILRRLASLRSNDEQRRSALLFLTYLAEEGGDCANIILNMTATEEEEGKEEGEEEEAGYEDEDERYYYEDDAFKVEGKEKIEEEELGEPPSLMQALTAVFEETHRDEHGLLRASTVQACALLAMLAEVVPKQAGEWFLSWSSFPQVLTYLSLDASTDEEGAEGYAENHVMRMLMFLLTETETARSLLTMSLDHTLLKMLHMGHYLSPKISVCLCLLVGSEEKGAHCGGLLLNKKYKILERVVDEMLDAQVVQFAQPPSTTTATAAAAAEQQQTSYKPKLVRRTTNYTSFRLSSPHNVSAHEATNTNSSDTTAITKAEMEAQGADVPLHVILGAITRASLSDLHKPYLCIPRRVDYFVSLLDALLENLSAMLVVAEPDMSSTRDNDTSKEAQVLFSTKASIERSVFILHHLTVFYQHDTRVLHAHLLHSGSISSNVLQPTLSKVIALGVSRVLSLECLRSARALQRALMGRQHPDGFAFASVGKESTSTPEWSAESLKKPNGSKKHVTISCHHGSGAKNDQGIVARLNLINEFASALAHFLKANVWTCDRGSAYLPGLEQVSMQNGNDDDVVLEAMDLSILVVVALSREYFESPVCRAEALYANKLALMGHVKVLFVAIDQDYTTISKPFGIEGWLERQLGMHTWFALWQLDFIDWCIEQITKSYASVLLHAPVVASVDVATLQEDKRAYAIPESYYVSTFTAFRPIVKKRSPEKKRRGTYRRGSHIGGLLKRK